MRLHRVVSRSGLDFCDDDFDFDEGSEGEGGDLDGGAGGFVVAEGGGVEGVDLGEVGHVGEEDGGFDDII